MKNEIEFLDTIYLQKQSLSPLDYEKDKKNMDWYKLDHLVGISCFSSGEEKLCLV